MDARQSDCVGVGVADDWRVLSIEVGGESEAGHGAIGQLPTNLNLKTSADRLKDGKSDCPST